ncbi:MAG: maintenance system killer protein, partial [Prevotella sp.]|nr:maintenance system killer protein [Prevotella sp.]
MKEALHINEVLQLLDKAGEERRKVNVRAWKKDGNEVDYIGWLPLTGHWRGGIHRLMNPQNGEVRAVI